MNASWALKKRPHGGAVSMMAMPEGASRSFPLQPNDTLWEPRQATNIHQPFNSCSCGMAALIFIIVIVSSGLFFIITGAWQIAWLLSGCMGKAPLCGVLIALRRALRGPISLTSGEITSAAKALSPHTCLHKETPWISRLVNDKFGSLPALTGLAGHFKLMKLQRSRPWEAQDWQGTQEPGTIPLERCARS